MIFSNFWDINKKFLSNFVYTDVTNAIIFAVRGVEKNYFAANSI